jgi:hypothetical protein
VSYCVTRGGSQAELDDITADPSGALCAMPATHFASTDAAWSRVSERLAPLAAAATAACSASSSISEAQLDDIQQCAAAVESILKRSVVLGPAAFTCSVPELLFRTVRLTGIASPAAAYTL